jgi:hypothetical protein
MLISEASAQLPQQAWRGGQGVNRGIVAAEGFDKGFGHAIALRRVLRCAARDHSEVARKGARFRVRCSCTP